MHLIIVNLIFLANVTEIVFIFVVEQSANLSCLVYFVCLLNKDNAVREFDFIGPSSGGWGGGRHIVFGLAVPPCETKFVRATIVTL